MSSNIELLRICKHCSIEFTAKTTVTKYCSLKCNQRAYKKKKREEKIQFSNTEMSFIKTQPIEELKVKPFLSITEACTLLGVSRRTIYRMIDRKELIVAKVGTRTIIRRADIDELFGKPIPIRVRKESQPVTEFYTVKEVENKYSIKYGRLNTIIKQNKIPKTIHNGKLNVSKRHLDKYLDKILNEVGNINEWYTVSEIQDKYGLSREQVYSRSNDNNIPKLRLGKYVKLSKLHFDELFVKGV